ncbi:MAG: hypothetical protein KIT31_36565, partial [Deltaproteobacteria bacterium]|nr:hypothetical protein [Deltaproteobacteria bacterium]
ADEPTPAAAPAARDLAAAVRARIPAIGEAGRFGDDKVFISALWDALDGDQPAGMTLDGFKRWLVEANAAQAVTLLRADLAPIMDQTLIAASEIVDRGATFHFVKDERAFAHRG